MCTEDFIIGLFLRVDAKLAGVAKHPQSKLWPGEVVTLAVRFVLKGGRVRAFYRWLSRDWRHLFPALPERTRLFRLMAAHQAWADAFLAAPTFFGVADSYGVELLHPVRQGRTPRQVGRKGLSNRRWIVGGKLGLVLNARGECCAWGAATANAYDAAAFGALVRRFAGVMVVLADGNFHAERGDPPNLKACPPRTWNERMVVETVLSMLTTVCHLKRQFHRRWRYFRMHLGAAMAALNLLLAWDPRHPRLSIAEFGL